MDEGRGEEDEEEGAHVRELCEVAAQESWYWEMDGPLLEGDGYEGRRDQAVGHDAIADTKEEECLPCGSTQHSVFQTRWLTSRQVSAMLEFNLIVHSV